MNLDGHLDAFVGCLGKPNRVWINDGTGKFADSGERLGDRPTTCVALGDFIRDGALDVWAANQSNPFKSFSNVVWLNTSKPKASEKTSESKTSESKTD